MTKNFVVKQFDKSFITSALKKIMAKLAFASVSVCHSVNNGCKGDYGYELYLQMLKSMSHKLTSEVLTLTLEDNVHIHTQTCTYSLVTIILFVM